MPTQSVDKKHVPTNLVFTYTARCRWDGDVMVVSRVLLAPIPPKIDHWGMWLLPMGVRPNGYVHKVSF
jgi:hypothetical protein